MAPLSCLKEIQQLAGVVCIGRGAGTGSDVTAECCGRVVTSWFPVLPGGLMPCALRLLFLRSLSSGISVTFAASSFCQLIRSEEGGGRQYLGFSIWGLLALVYL